MALIKCEECGHEISGKARTCPNCGCPVSVVEQKDNPQLKTVNNEHKRKSKWGLLTGVIVLVLLLGAAAFYFLKKPGADVANISKKTERKEENKSNEREISASTNTWTGASSVDELKRKIVGTTWHCKMPREYGGFILKFVFSEGSVKKYTADPHEGKWEDGYITYSYSVEVVRDNNGNNQVVVSLSNSTNREKGFREDIAFFNKCTKVVYFRGTDIGGIGNAQPMEFGDFTWSNEL